MLKNTFIHIPGIGLKTEKRFWDSGIYGWDEFAAECPIRLSRKRLNTITRYLQESNQSMESSNPKYFSDLLPANLHWRFFPEFRNQTVYLDIETTGLESRRNIITTIALYDGNSITWYVNGQNLDDFLDDINRYQVIITYNGKCFDVPFIESYFGIVLNHTHIDLRHVLRSLGYKGGLKACEAQLGMDRGELTDIDGFFAILLWYDYQRNQNQKALETLLSYNIQDVLNLEKLMIISYNMKIKDTPFFKRQLPEPTIPEIPFNVDRETVDRIRSNLDVGYTKSWY